MATAFNTPVVLFTNRDLALTTNVLEVLKPLAPAHILLVGEYSPQEKGTHGEMHAEELHTLKNHIQWKCSVRAHGVSRYLIGRDRMATALNWVFNEVEEAIIVEDYCLPSVHFFDFCSALLERFRNDALVASISGISSTADKQSEYSYYYSRFFHSGAWASWRRAWQCFDPSFQKWPEFKAGGLLQDALPEETKQLDAWDNAFERILVRRLDRWDLQLTFGFWTQGMLNIHPTRSLSTRHDVPPEFRSSFEAVNLEKAPAFRVKNRASELADEEDLLHSPWLGDSTPISHLTLKPTPTAIADVWRLFEDAGHTAIGNKMLHLFMLLKLAETRGVQPVLPFESKLDNLFTFREGMKVYLSPHTLRGVPFIYDEIDEAAGKDLQECIGRAKQQYENHKTFLQSEFPKLFTLRGHFWHHEFMPRPSTFNHYLQIRPELIETQITKYPSIIDDSAVAVHLRDTDFASHLRNVFHRGIMLDDVYYEKAIERIEKSSQAPSEYHLFSDNMPRLENIFRRRGLRYVIHEDNAYVDWVGLFLAKRIISSNSTFSWTACLYNKDSVILPEGGYNYFEANGSIPYGFAIPGANLISSKT